MACRHHSSKWKAPYRAGRSSTTGDTSRARLRRNALPANASVISTRSMRCSMKPLRVRKPVVASIARIQAASQMAARSRIEFPSGSRLQPKGDSSKPPRCRAPPATCRKFAAAYVRRIACARARASSTRARSRYPSGPLKSSLTNTPLRMRNSMQQLLRRTDSASRWLAAVRVEWLARMNWRNSVTPSRFLKHKRVPVVYSSTAFRRSNSKRGSWTAASTCCVGAV